MLVRDCMTRHAKLIRTDATVREAATQMRDADTGFLPVGDDNRLLGVVTDRDIVVRGLVAGADPSSQTVAEVMTKDVLYCFDNREVADAERMFGDLKVRRLPVVDQDKNFVGVITLGDIAAQVSGNDANEQAGVGETLHQIAAAE